MLDADPFVAPWNGTWDIETDVGFLNDGSITVTQTSDKDAAITVASGLNGGTISNVKIIGGQLLVFRLRAFSFFEGTVKTVTFGLFIDSNDIGSAEGEAKVKGSKHSHEASADLQNGTAPTQADVRFLGLATKDGNKHLLIVGLANFGLAAVPREGCELIVVFGDNTGDPQQTVQITLTKMKGVVGNGASVIEGHTARHYWFEPMLSSKFRPYVQIAFTMPEGWNSNLSVAISIVDEAGGPNIPPRTSSGFFSKW